MLALLSEVGGSAAIAEVRRENRALPYRTRMTDEQLAAVEMSCSAAELSGTSMCNVSYRESANISQIVIWGL
jgi:hypothetical protein